MSYPSLHRSLSKATPSSIGNHNHDSPFAQLQPMEWMGVKDLNGIMIVLTEPRSVVLKSIKGLGSLTSGRSSLVSNGA